MSSDHAPSSLHKAPEGLFRVALMVNWNMEQYAKLYTERVAIAMEACRRAHRKGDMVAAARAASRLSMALYVNCPGMFGSAKSGEKK